VSKLDAFNSPYRNLKKTFTHLPLDANTVTIGFGPLTITLSLVEPNQLHL